MKNAVCTTSNLNEGDESHVLKWIKSLHCFETSKILYALTSSGSSLLDYLLEIIKDKVDVEENDSLKNDLSTKNLLNLKFKINLSQNDKLKEYIKKKELFYSTFEDAVRNTLKLELEGLCDSDKVKSE